VFRARLSGGGKRLASRGDGNRAPASGNGRRSAEAATGRVRRNPETGSVRRQTAAARHGLSTGIAIQSDSIVPGRDVHSRIVACGEMGWAGVGLVRGGEARARRGVRDHLSYEECDGGGYALFISCAQTKNEKVVTTAKHLMSTERELNS
jgi:hypothetical protein